MSRSIWRLGLATLLVGGAVSFASEDDDPITGSIVWVVELDGAIGPASADYFTRALARADDEGVNLLVLRLDTPGGLDKSMRDMIKAILASRVPVATYVAPNGSRAASAGTYIMYASHIAAMAPATNIGSSTPVSIGGDGSPLPFPTAPDPLGGPEEGGGDSEQEEAGAEEESDAPAAQPSGTAMDRKVVNDAVSYIKGLAELRGRNVEWAEATVRDAANLTAQEALESNVIDIVADDLTDLLEAIDGRTVNAGGMDVVVRTSDAEVEFIEPDWRYELLGVITDPNVAVFLLMIGFYGLIFEFYSPGVGFGAVVGVICLLLGAFALQMLPINYAGLALIVVGLGLLTTEAFTPSFGVFGVGGVIAFVVGAIMLMDTDLPAYQISKPVIAALAALSVALVVFVLGAAVRARRARAASGKESMVGGRAEVVEDFQGKGRVRAFGEVWQAEADADEVFEKGTRVTIAAFDGLTAVVEKPQSKKD